VAALVVAVVAGVLVMTPGIGPAVSPTSAPPASTATATPLAAQTTPASTSTPAPRYDGMVVGFVQTGTEASWRGANTASFKDDAIASGITLKVSYAEHNYGTEIDALQNLIADTQVQVIVFAAVRTDGWDAILKAAKKAGKPVIVEDLKITSSPSLYYTYVGPDYVAEGEKGAAAMCTLLEGTKTKNVFEIRGTATSPATIDRAKGFRAGMGSCGIVIKSTATADWDRTKAQDATAAYLKANMNIQGIVAQNDDMAIGAIQAIKAAGLRPGKDIQVIGFDGTRDAFQAMIDGELGATVECSPDAAPLVYKYAWGALHQMVSPGAFMPTEDQVFFASQGPQALYKILAGRKY
jgi:ABC-type sugar transport system substrate-binding protein